MEIKYSHTFQYVCTLDLQIYNIYDAGMYLLLKYFSHGIKQCLERTSFTFILISER